MRRFALSFGLFAGSLAGAFAQAPATLPAAIPAPVAAMPATLPAAMPVVTQSTVSQSTVSQSTVSQSLVTNPFPANRQYVDVIPESASEQLTNEKIMTAPTVWASAEYQLMYAQNANVISLIDRIPAQFVTQSNSVADAGRISEFPGARDLRYRAINSWRVSGGYRFSTESAVDASYFATESISKTEGFRASGSLGQDGYGRPYIQAGTGNVVEHYIVYPGNYGGEIAASTKLEAYGVDINYRRDTYRFFVDRTELLAGVRYFNLGEEVTIRDFTTPSNGTIRTVDQFQTRNNFYGGQVGFHSRLYGCKWSLDYITKFAMGGVRQEVRASGSNTVTTNGVATTERGGLFAREGNIGNFSRSKFAVMAESQFLVGYGITENVRLHIGYSGQWISSAIRAPEIINPTVNDSRIRYISQGAFSNANQPTFQWNRASDFYLQGITFGVTMGY